LPIRTHRGRAAVYRMFWGWPVRSPKHLAATVLALVVITIGAERALPEGRVSAVPAVPSQSPQASSFASAPRSALGGAGIAHGTHRPPPPRGAQRLCCVLDHPDTLSSSNVDCTSEIGDSPSQVRRDDRERVVVRSALERLRTKIKTILAHVAQDRFQSAMDDGQRYQRACVSGDDHGPPSTRAFQRRQRGFQSVLQRTSLARLRLRPLL